MQEQHDTMSSHAGLRKRNTSEDDATIVVEDTIQIQTVAVATEEEKEEQIVSSPISGPASLNRIGKLLILASVIASIGFWLLGSSIFGFTITPYGAKTLLKWLSIAFIIVMVVRYCNLRTSRQEFWFVIALVFHSLGDVILAQGVTLPSIPAFFLGHLFYIFMFWFDLPSRDRLHSGITKKKLTLFLVLSTTEILLGASILPLLPLSLVVPVFCYMLVIYCFASVALLPIYKFRWMILGVMCYCASDTLIAIDLFYTRLGYLALLSWPLYYFSQMFLAVGFLKEKGKVSSVFIERPIGLATIKQTRVYSFSEKFIRRINLPV